MRFRHITRADNKKIVITIGKVIIEMGALKVRNTHEDAELEGIFEAYQKIRFIYFVVENRNKILGGKGVAPVKMVILSLVNFKKCILFLEIERRIWESVRFKSLMILTKQVILSNAILKPRPILNLLKNCTSKQALNISITLLEIQEILPALFGC